MVDDIGRSELVELGKGLAIFTSLTAVVAKLLLPASRVLNPYSTATIGKMQ